MKKILFISNITKKITNFSYPSILAGQALGYEFHMAANFSEFNDDASKYNVITHHLDLVRNPFNIKNIKAYKQLLNLLQEKKFDVIHCNTPIGGVLGRFCGEKAKVPIVIYTAHGFHFYKGAPLINKTIFKWAEMRMARYTDAIITMNKEDYEAAQKFKLRNNGNVYYVPGVGVDTKAYQPINVDQRELKESLGLKKEDVVLIAMGDLISRKNYVSSIKAIKKANNKKLHLLICGAGPKLRSLQKMANILKVQDQIHFLGFRTDIKELLNIADIFLFTTYQEGLPRSLMEAMSAGLPCIVSNVRGNVDLIEDGKGGFLCNPDDVNEIANAINILATDEKLRKLMGKNNLETIKKFDIERVKRIIKKIYLIEVNRHGQTC